MNKAIKVKKIWFAVALTLTILGAIAIPGIIFSAIYHKYFLMAVSILFAADLVYGVPIFWINFGSAKKNYVITDAVLSNGLITVGDICLFLQITENEACTVLKTCIKKKYLTNMLLVGNTLVATDKKFVGKERFCEYCGGEIPSGHITCPSCGALYKKTTNNY